MSGAEGATGAIRGAVVLPRADGSLRLEEDAVVRWDAGRIVEVAEPSEADAPHSGCLLSPGFVDLHVHWPQSHVRGRFAGALLPWLRESIWPAEAAFADPDVARSRGAAFLDALHSAGTTAALTFGPPYLQASRAFLGLAPRGFFDGPALMERNSLPALERPVEATLAELEALPTTERARFAVTPRFAPNVGAAGLRACAQMAARAALPAQSHLSENPDELAWVASLFPEAASYTDVYDRAGLLGPHVVMAHAIHLSDAELERLAATGTMVAHCPTSNEALGSGRMPLERLRQFGVAWCLATDVGAGPQLSQLHVIDTALTSHHAAGVALTASEAWARATAVPGAFLARFDQGLHGLGTFEPGAPAHLVALPLGAAADAADPVEARLLATLTAAAPDYESAPIAVWSWGYRLPSSRALSGPTSSTAS